jgi:phytoene dehydrogenase-like protein
MAARLTELGGNIELNAPVAEIMAEAGKATGVRLQDGRVISARAVVASIHPKTAFELVTPGALPRRALTSVRLAPANAHGGAPLKIDIALRGQVSVPRHQALRSDGVELRKCVLLIGTSDAVLENFRASARGEVPRQLYTWNTVPSAVDPSQAPAGQDIAYLYPVAMPVNPGAGWDAIRTQVSQQVIDQSSDYMTGLKEFEIGRRVEASPDLAKRLNVHNGCVVHIDTGATRSGVMRPAYGLGGETLPVAGLFLGGAGIHPGGGINGLPGRIAAGRVGRYLSK